MDVGEAYRRDKKAAVALEALRMALRDLPEGDDEQDDTCYIPVFEVVGKGFLMCSLASLKEDAIDERLPGGSPAMEF